MKNGIILVNKEINKTSRDMVNDLNHIFNMKKIGHTGTLDPIATGVLVMCLGKYTKLIDLLSSIKKEYIATIKLGIQTDTQDITGNITMKQAFNIKEKDIIEVFSQMIGSFKQTIPIYSAKKINGKKLYEYARNNEKVDLPQNEVTIYDIQLIDFKDDLIIFKTLVSKGTYIRSLITEICQMLNTVGTMQSLQRTKQGDFSIDDCFTINDIKNGKYNILKAKDILNYPIYNLNHQEYQKVINGSKMNFISNEQYLILLYNNNEIAIYQKDNNIYRIKVMLV